MMKKLSCLLALLCVAMLYSCDKDKVPEGKVRVTVTASAKDMMASLKDFEGKSYYTGKLPDNLRLRINFFVYDVYDTEELVEQKTVYLDDVTKTATYYKETVPGSLQVIATGDLVEVKDNSVKLIYNKVEADDASVSVSIKSENFDGRLNVAGCAISRELYQLTGGAEVGVNLVIKPLGNLVNTKFYNVNPSKDREIHYGVPESFSGYLIEDGKTEDLRFSTAEMEEAIQTVEGKDVYYTQHYVVSSDKNITVRWNSIGEYKSKSFPFLRASTTNVEIDLATNNVWVYDVEDKDKKLR